jgi:hypothetical protein
MANKFFQPNGDLLPGLKWGDPYRRPNEDDGTISYQEFNDGEPTAALLEAALAVVSKGTAHPDSVAAQLVHAAHFASCTKGNYSTCYYWRREP